MTGQPTLAAMGLGSPLQKVAMGLVVVVAYAYFPAEPSPSWERYDALADPVGWVLVVLGMVALGRANDAFALTRWLAVLAGVVSVPMWLPQLNHRLDASGEWFASLPQLLFCLLLAREIGVLATLQEPRDAYVAKRFGLLVWGFALAAVLPVVDARGRRRPAGGPDPAGLPAGQRGARLLPVPGAPTRVARRSRAPRDPRGPSYGHDGVGPHRQNWRGATEVPVAPRQVHDRGRETVSASGGDDVEVDLRLDVVVHLDGDGVGAERLDRVAHHDGALVDLAAGLGDRARRCRRR